MGLCNFTGSRLTTSPAGAVWIWITRLHPERPGSAQCQCSLSRIMLQNGNDLSMAHEALDDSVNDASIVIPVTPTHLLRTVIANFVVECILRAKTIPFKPDMSRSLKRPEKTVKAAIAIASAKWSKLEADPSLSTKPISLPK